MYKYRGNENPMGCSSTRREKRYKNGDGSTYSKDDKERITSFKYADENPVYHFEYNENGTISTIDRTDGWNWRKINTREFTGWVIRNYWDCWQVEDQTCSVYVDENGIKTTSGMSVQLALP